MGAASAESAQLSIVGGASLHLRVKGKDTLPHGRATARCVPVSPLSIWNQNEKERYIIE